MKITFLGTGAADWNRQDHSTWPGFRRNASVLIDDILLIDPGPDVPDALVAFGKDPKNVQYIINTHKHSDHYSPETLAFLSHAVFTELEAGEECQVGPYKILALPANHSTCAKTVHFIISDGKKRIFYGLDGAWLLYDEYRAIRNAGIDLAVIDATIGFVDGDFRIFEHNNLNMVLEMKKTLDPWVHRWCISHMARTLHTDHDTLSATMATYGVETAFDGFVLSV